MTPMHNNNLSPLPFYTDIAEQHHRKYYAFGKIYPLYAPSSFFLPFQIMRETSADAISSAYLYTKDGTQVADILSALITAGLRVLDYSAYGYDVIMYPGNLSNSLNIADGQYYMVISDGTNTWYSEVMTIVQTMTNYIKIEWYDSEDLIADCGIINYEGYQYKNKLYFATELGRPEYPFEEDGEARDGYFFAEKQVSSKTYKFTILAPEFLLDVMRMIRLSDNIKVVDNYSREYTCDTFLMSPEWLDQGDLASVGIEFTTATVVKKIGRGYYINRNIDFNDDYNDDYNG